MPFKKKSYRKIGDIYVPRPPTGATHILFQTPDKKGKATVVIKSIDTLLGSIGTIKYLKLNSRKKLVKAFDEEYHWDGKKVKKLVG